MTRPGVADRVAVLTGLLGAQQRAVADAGHFDRARLARHQNADARRLAVRVRCPIRSGSAISSPSASRVVMSASTVEGSVPA